MYRVKLTATSPIEGGSGEREIQLPYVPHKGDLLMVGPSKTRWEVLESTFIVHDEYHPKKDFVDVVLRVESYSD